MAWTNEGDALHLVNPANPGAVDSLTSTSTVLCYDEGMSAFFLRMFGLLPGQVWELGPESVVQGPAPTNPGSVIQGDWLNVAFIESARAPAGSDWATALSFDLQPWNGVTSYPLRSTVVPVIKTGVTIEKVDNQHAFYKDIQLVHLPNDAGWLMLMVRTSSAGPLGPVAGVDPVEGNSSTAIVAYWAPEHDGTFTGALVQGPYWLVDRMHVIGEDSIARNVALWLGVPSGVVVEDSTGKGWLYVYYTAEVDYYAPVDTLSEYPRGTWLRKIEMSTLADIIGFTWSTDPIPDDPEWPGDGGLAEAAPAGLPSAETSPVVVEILGSSDWADHSTPVAAGVRAGRTAGEASDPTEWTDETAWSSDTGAGLVEGLTCGKIRVWVATGTAFGPGEEPSADAKGNTEIEDLYYSIRVNDAVPVACPSGIALFFCGNYYNDDAEAVEPADALEGWGIWRASALQADVVSEYGLDFVVQAGAPDNVGERDFIAKGEGKDANIMDPDPVQMPDGSWLVFAGHGTLQPMQRYAGAREDGCHSPEDAWE